VDQGRKLGLLGRIVARDDGVTMISPIWHISGSRKPRLVVAGVPTRIPEAVFGGFLSNGMAFLLTVMRSRRGGAPPPCRSRQGA